MAYEKRITKTLDRSPARDIGILVVEDDHRFERLLKDMLDAFGFTDIEVAYNGKDAIKLLKSRKFDIVLSDWEMQGMDGIELVNFIRNEKESPNAYISFILVTGKAEHKHVEEARDMGITEFLVKPFTVDMLRDRIISVFENPREFILCQSYHGPCRRRKDQNPPNDTERRAVA